MLVSIIKRDGTEVPFDSVKILNAITKANQAVGGEDMSPTDLLFVTEKVCKKLESRSLKHVEEIQDVVEETPHPVRLRQKRQGLHSLPRRAYERSVMRNRISWIFIKNLPIPPALQEDIKRENANIDAAIRPWEPCSSMVLKAQNFLSTTTFYPRMPRPRISTATSIFMTKILHAHGNVLPDRPDPPV